MRLHTLCFAVWSALFKISLNIGVGKLVCIGTYLRRLFLCGYLRHLPHGLNISVINNADFILDAFRNNREYVADFLPLRPSACNNAVLREWLVMNFDMSSFSWDLFATCASVGSPWADISNCVGNQTGFFRVVRSLLKLNVTLRNVHYFIYAVIVNPT
jgi:hypothetical protein